MRAVLIFKLIRHLVRQIFRVMFAQNWLLTARARLALSSVNKSPRTGPPPCSPTICRRDEVSLDEVQRILIPPFPGSNPGAPATIFSIKSANYDVLPDENATFSCRMTSQEFRFIFNGPHSLRKTPCDMTATWNA